MKSKWSQYALEIEKISSEDGGGWRAYYPTLGFAAYGVGMNLESALKSLCESCSALELFWEEMNLEWPKPSMADLENYIEETKQQDISPVDDFEYAA